MGRALKWIGVLLLLAIGLPILLLLAINFRDEQLTPQTKAFLEGERAPVPDEQNGFYYLLGFNAPLADDPHKAGKTWFAALNATQEKILAGAQVPWPAQPEGLPKIATMAELCSPERDSCNRSLKEKAESRRAVEENSAIVRRYHALHGYPAYYDATEARVFTYPLPAFATANNAQRLYFLDLAQRLDKGEVEPVLGALGEDIALARRMLAGSRSTIHKMVGNAFLLRATLFTSDVLTHYRAAIGPRASVLAEALRPLTLEERALMPAVRGDIRMAASATEPSRWRGEDIGLPVNSVLLKPFYQHRSSMNLLYRLVQPWEQVDNATARDVYPTLTRVDTEQPKFSLSNAAYNPVGKLITFIYAPQPTMYFERLLDTDTLVRLVALQAELVAAGGEATPALLAKHANPYTGKPFDWDAEKRRLSFEPRSRYLRGLKVGGSENRVIITL
jgi:hypothetical protein